MQSLRKLLILSILFVSALRPVYGDPCNQDCDNCGEAYSQSCYSSHWSAYVPIAVMIAAAIWFGVADGKSKDCSSSSNSQDGLGSMGSRSGSSSRSCYRSSSSHSSCGYHSH